MPTKKEIWRCKQIFSGMVTVRNEVGEEESTMGENPPFYISTAIEK